MRHALHRPSDTLSPITLRIADACRITGIGRSKFYELIKIGAITLVPMSGIQRLLKRGRPGIAER